MKQPKLSPKIVLCIAAHPDDIDYWAGGSVAAWAAAGAEIYYLILTDGGRGTSDRYTSAEALSATRETEQRTAAAGLGVTDVYFAGFTDGELQNNHDLKRQIVRYIRELQPDLVVTWDPDLRYSAEYGFINHADHRAAGEATLESVYPLARNVLSYPELIEESGLQPHTVKHLLLMTLPDHHNFSVDISPTLDLKQQAMRTHTSQTGDDGALIRNWAGSLSEGGTPHIEHFVRIDISI